ncbi:acetyl-CoA carboxylase biotin carboxylase subunit [candidate division WOR-3 bacterium 4484_100]|uniref:Acetyl-CoA carboxylase biotin carboxylase subunit n=1 Tax=candidate division WOR-3 bacterium 4484_100 TaxID=1936077 RepID=A0A1V4QE87_UNCW3|nr:MAG: acetyl-CoA carboxylase biotin carboxylase subunit [candidate division WOR-3 bacterium 4484_100]
MFKKILIANRGEIAVRVLRACKEMGITGVTVYSDSDRSALHTRYADEVYYIGPSPATESYLRIEKIIEVAKKCGAEAIHPGYGFLAENKEFARACENNSIVFIGPNSKAIELLGDKIASKITMRKAGIPVIPGSDGPVKTEAEALKIAEQIGFPVLIKAAGGGGGKGMRVVRKRDELATAMKQAIGEAESAFGNPVIFIEKFLESPRHIEFQILADNYGDVVHLFERECSVQRRHQKLIEEAPSAIMTPELRKRMGDAAVKAVMASNYNNAGTVEFMVDKERNFYFLEMNTRLQVEHPVTELVTGIDIVKEQLKIASGERLSLRQEDIKLNGCAMECRISAEDPENNFVPSTGTITALIEPGGPGVRVESGVYEGFTVPIYYDPLIAKLLVWGSTRQEVIERMKRALDEYLIRGIKTSIPFHRLVMENPEFVSGNYDTTFIDRVLGKIEYKKSNHKVAAIAGVIAKMLEEKRVSVVSKAKSGGMSPWKYAGLQAQLRSRLNF